MTGVVVSALLCLCLVWWALRKRPDRKATYEQDERGRMPAELRTAQLVVSEKTLWKKGDAAIVGKFDQVFLTQAGWLVPVETKPRVEASHILQLSAQAEILRGHARQLGGRVASWGYLRIRDRRGDVVYRRTALMTPEEVELVRRRWWQLRGGAEPIARPKPGRCRHCGFAARCADRVR